MYEKTLRPVFAEGNVAAFGFMLVTSQWHFEASAQYGI